MTGIATTQFSDLTFARAADACVGIVLRVSGTTEAATRCLRALQQATSGIAVEAAVVDDGAETGVATALAEIVGSQRVHAVQRGDARAAMVAATAGSTAPFLWFVDDSVEVEPGCLAALLAVMRTQSACGAVGVKLLGREGCVVQAGGVVWNDGSRCGYGRGDPAEAAHCNYLREVDYCSGAALLVRREAIAGRPVFDDAWPGVDWAEVGLAFALRQHRWKVLYCPRAIAVHHGSTMAGGDLYGGVHSAILAANVFRERWRATLARRHFPPCQRMFRAREHALGRRVLLVVDHYLPQPDRDAGSRAIVQTMSALQDMGFLVKFWPANQAYASEARALEDAGIEVLVGERWGGRFERFIRYAGQELDAVLLSRPDVAGGVIDLLQAHSSARLLFYGHDLHHRRMMLRAQVNDDDEERIAADAMRDLEGSLWRRVDAVIYPSDEEADVAAAHVGAARAHAVPLYVFADDELAAPREPSQGVHLLFVAGFGHSPNIDAAQWLVRDILPRVRTVCPDATLDLVGSNPTAEVRALAEVPGVAVSGNVSADVLADYYRRATVAVVPLRFGAGVKLKVLEAMARGVPVVTTPVGAQGLPEVERCIRVAADADALAAAIIAASRNPDAANTAAARDYVRQRYTGSGMQDALWRTLVAA